MRQDSTKSYITWSAEVPEATALELKHLLPITGARTWVIETGLEKFLSLMEASEPLQKEAHDAIQGLVEEASKQYPLVKMNVRLPGALYDRFNRLFPEYGAATWFWRRFLDCLNSHMRDSATIEDLIDRSVATMGRALKAEMA